MQNMKLIAIDVEEMSLLDFDKLSVKVKNMPEDVISRLELVGSICNGLKTLAKNGISTEPGKGHVIFIL